MSSYYSQISPPSRGAWVVHHSQKTNSTVNGSAEFPIIDLAGKAASLLSQLAASENITIEKQKVDALARAAGLNPRLEVPPLLQILKESRAIDTSVAGDVSVLGITSRAAVQHAGDIFERQNPNNEERATIAIAELTSAAPAKEHDLVEFVSDEFKITSAATKELIQRSETIGFVDSEGSNQDKLVFNGNLFRRDNIVKCKRVLDSLSAADTQAVSEFEDKLNRGGCVSVMDAERILGERLFSKLRAAGMYDINHVANSNGEFGFVTRPAAFHKFNDPLVDDAFDLAKALVAALTYGMTQSASSRGRIDMIGALLRKLISGGTVGPATAIGEDYKILESRGVIQVTRGESFGYKMRLLKKDVGEMALSVLTTGDASLANAIDRPFPGAMTGYSGPEKVRSTFRQKQIPASKKLTFDVLETLRTKGRF